jgi:hypothetical protein
VIARGQLATHVRAFAESGDIYANKPLSLFQTRGNDNKQMCAVWWGLAVKTVANHQAGN